MLYAALTQGSVEIWEFGGKTWELIKAAHQPIRCDDNGCLFQYDAGLKRSVLVDEERNVKEPLGWDGHEWGMAGGTGTQTWLWDGVDWIQVSEERPPRGRPIPASFGSPRPLPLHHESHELWIGRVRFGGARQHWGDSPYWTGFPSAAQSWLRPHRRAYVV